VLARAEAAVGDRSPAAEATAAGRSAASAKGNTTAQASRRECDLRCRLAKHVRATDRGTSRAVRLTLLSPIVPPQQRCRDRSQRGSRAARMAPKRGRQNGWLVVTCGTLQLVRKTSSAGVPNRERAKPGRVAALRVFVYFLRRVRCVSQRAYTLRTTSRGVQSSVLLARTFRVVTLPISGCLVFRSPAPFSPSLALCPLDSCAFRTPPAHREERCGLGFGIGRDKGRRDD